jgi:hypothetical protein
MCYILNGFNPLFSPKKFSSSFMIKESHLGIGYIFSKIKQELNYGKAIEKRFKDFCLGRPR